MTTKRGFNSNKYLKTHLRTNPTIAENKLWLKLKHRQFSNLKFRRQHGIGPYIVDFYCPEKKLVVEVDGDIHAEDQQILKDKKKERYLKGLGLRIIRYGNLDVIKNIEGVLEDLYSRVTKSTPP